MRTGGDVAEELSKLDDYTIQSRDDARAICDALSRLPEATSTAEAAALAPRLQALARLFQDVESPESPAFEVLFEQGQPLLVGLLDSVAERTDPAEAEELLVVLKILAMYGSREGAEKVVEAARRPLKPEGYLWHVVLSVFAEGHPQREFVFEALSDPLPEGFIAVSLLDAATGVAIEGELAAHPFDSAEGKRRLRRWLEDRDPENYSYAHSATAALPFVSNPERDQLLALALDHADPGVQMEAAWAAGKLGREAGCRVLARFCRELAHAAVAQQYLVELGREDLIPEESLAPDFQAKAEMANWLAHPNELAQPPDELDIVDHRTLAWPPDGEPVELWLIKYVLRDTTGLEEDDVDCGLVGSVTFCLFTRQMHLRPPEDAYAMHCYWEMEMTRLIEEIDATDPDEYAGMLGQWRGTPLQNAVITRVAELSPELNYPRRLVALGPAEREGEPGWVALDGSESRWYARREMPPHTLDSTVLAIHVGRQLLGLTGEPDRAARLEQQPRRPDRRQIADAYQRLLTEAENAGPNRQKELLGPWSLLSRHFDAYVEARAGLENVAADQVLIDVYERFLQLARNADPSVQSDAYDALGVLGEHFDRYVEALIGTGRTTAIGPLLDLFEPYWNNNLGRSRLGLAAFKAGRLEVAEVHLAARHEKLTHYYRGEDMSRLAEIWHRQGKADAARALLIDCLQKLASEVRSSKYLSDRKMCQEDFQIHRDTFFRLFGGGEDELKRAGVPAMPK